ncbi:hypothetical protein HY639_00335 [Candidatus Woesearchaeota archaeon]|nr:hypothetical protein [Candidatus Woesearchaeota archaeon]
MVTFKCGKCKYEFRLKNPEKKTPPTRCPYCATAGVVTVKQHIIKELFP